MSIVDYFRASNLPNRKESRIKLRVAVLTSLKVFQDRETEERLAKRRKLNDDTGSSRSGTAINTEMISGLGEEDEKYERFLNEINAQRNEINNLRGENLRQREEIKRLHKRELNAREARERELEALRNNNENNMVRNNKYLNGTLAYEKITAFELWREILMFL